MLTLIVVLSKVIEILEEAENPVPEMVNWFVPDANVVGFAINLGLIVKVL